MSSELIKALAINVLISDENQDDCGRQVQQEFLHIFM